jgi:hypothetical protein
MRSKNSLQRLGNFPVFLPTQNEIPCSSVQGIRAETSTIAGEIRVKKGPAEQFFLEFPDIFPVCWEFSPETGSSLTASTTRL